MWRLNKGRVPWTTCSPCPLVESKFQIPKQERVSRLKVLKSEAAGSTDVENPEKTSGDSLAHSNQESHL